MQQQAADYTRLDDPELFAECRHAREKLLRLPACHADRAPLNVLLSALNNEFDRRARLAWTASARREA